IFWALWIVPAFTFLWFVDSSEPGHNLLFLGALIAIGAGLVVYTRQFVIGPLLVIAQAAIFLLAAPQADGPLAWTLNSMLLNVTAPGLRQQQASLDSTLNVIRSGFNPQDTLVVTLIGQDPYRFLMYYLPEYRVVRLDPQTHTVLTAQDAKQGNWTEASHCLLAGNAVWVLSRPTEPGTIPDGARLLSADDGGPFQVWEDPLPTEYLGFDIGVTRCAGR